MEIENLQIEKLHTEVLWTLLWIVSMVSNVIHHRKQICKGLGTIMFLSAVLDLASRFHKSLSDLLTLTFSEKKSRKLLISWVRLFFTQIYFYFQGSKDRKRCLNAVKYCPSSSASWTFWREQRGAVLGETMHLPLRRLSNAYSSIPLCVNQPV